MTGQPALTRVGALSLDLDELPGKLRKGSALVLHPEGKHFSLPWLAAPGRTLVRYNDSHAQ